MVTHGQPRSPESRSSAFLKAMSERSKIYPAPALVLAFAPAVVFLTLLGISAASGKNLTIPALWMACMASVICCFASSFLLFRRKTGWAIAAGIFFLFLNGAISFFLGCVAAFKLV